METKTAPDIKWSEFARCSVAGLQYHDYQRIVDPIQADDPVELRYEPSNAYSRNAVAVYVHDTKIGYVPESVSPKLVAARNNFRWRARVVSFNPTNPTWHMCTIQIEYAHLDLENEPNGQRLTLAR